MLGLSMDIRCHYGQHPMDANRQIRHKVTKVQMTIAGGLP